MELLGRRHVGRRVRAAVVGTATVLSGALVATSPPAGAAPSVGAPGTHAACPWASSATSAGLSPSDLAAEVLARMTLQDKLDVVDLTSGKGYENRTTAVPSLCIPALTLEDGPNGLAYHDRGVTQLPAAIGVAASFDPALARAFGSVEGNEARRQGVDVIQGPNLNIARTPEAGRVFEGYGEDPLLVSELGVADIEGIQSEGVMADAKHFGVYTQETDRIPLDQDVSERALQEIYLPPFKAAVTEAKVASLMCAYGEIDGVETCSDPSLYRTLHTWGFAGFVRSDLAADPAAGAAFAAGLDQIKPAEPAAIVAALANGSLSEARLDRAVERVLEEMFAYGLIAHPLRGRPHVSVDNRSHATFALDAAEQSMVLLKDRGGVLPLRPKAGSSVAVIGVDASTEALSAGGGSAHVVPPFVSTPLRALESELGRRVTVTFSPGGSGLGPAPAIAGTDRAVSPSIATRGLAMPKVPATRAIGTGTLAPDLAGMHRWSAELVAPRTGTYVVSLTANGDAWLTIDGERAISRPGLSGRSVWTTEAWFHSGQHVHLVLEWYRLAKEGPPAVGWRYAGDEISQAVAAARHAAVAVVFAGVYSTEGADRPSLALPSDENALISAVAAANPRTVVVLNTPGAVLMPWLGKVAAVLEAWYPGEEDGAATAAVLTGRFDPSGHLPLTFPAREDATPADTAAAWPGVDGVVHLDEGLDVGYRYDDAYGVKPLFPFGYGLSYTTFAVSGLVVTEDSSGALAEVSVTNTGTASGSAVVQAYLTFPPAAGEPPLDLVGFTRTTLRPGETAEVTIDVPASAFSCYLGSSWQEVAGTYTLHVGTSSADLPLAAELVAPSPTGVPGATSGSGPLGPAGASGSTGLTSGTDLANEPLARRAFG